MLSTVHLPYLDLCTLIVSHRAVDNLPTSVDNPSAMWITRAAEAF
ncbi:MAG: hypothetical protein RML46_11400 [Anaerolineae bacterium]|nr:hypothetical protein [Anaerolineae bacterium]MDW8069508.1 hypothetical protein [Anaerolineae bacterium]